MKRVIMVLMALCLFGVTTISTIACSRDRTNGEEPINTSMTQLYVSNFDGGFGSQWLEDVAEAFENANATTSFESGKTGVQVRIDKNKDKGNQLNFNTTNNEVFFCEEVSYFNFARNWKHIIVS